MKLDESSNTKLSAKKVGFNINTSKTQAVMQMSSETRFHQQMPVGKSEIKVVNSFTNLESGIFKAVDT